MATLPIVHSNGTSREELVGQLREVSKHLRRAQWAMGEATPHGRDYYLIAEPGVYQKARDEHRERCLKLQALMDEVNQMALDIQNS